MERLEAVTRQGDRLHETSSLRIDIAAGAARVQRHFLGALLQPAALPQAVEIIPHEQTDPALLDFI